MLADIVRIADTETVDVVLIAGDLYETAAPTPDAEALVLKTLLDLRDTGAQVIVISGNHDNAPRFEAVRPLFAALGVVVMGAPRRPADGGVVEVDGSFGRLGARRARAVPLAARDHPHRAAHGPGRRARTSRPTTSACARWSRRCARRSLTTP